MCGVEVTGYGLRVGSGFGPESDFFFLFLFFVFWGGEFRSHP